MTTHRDLFTEAEAHLARATALTSQRHKLPDAEAAAAFHQHDRLTAALARHLEYLHGRAVGDLGLRFRGTNLPARDSATNNLIVALRPDDSRDEDDSGPAGRSNLAAALAGAADAIRLATDVLATHRGPDHEARTPDAHLLDDLEARWGVTVRAADLAYTAAMARARLISCLPPEQHPRHAADVVSGTKMMAAARGALTTAGATGPGSKAIAELPPFAAPLPQTNPLASTATALQYARAEAHRLGSDRRLGAASLRDVALLALSLAQHTDAITRAATARAADLRPGDRADTPADALHPAAGAARDLARRWRTLYEQLRHLRSPDPPQPGLAHAALAVRAGLEARTRRDSRWATPAEMHPTPTAMADLLTGIRLIALPLDELAAAGEHALTHLQRRGQLYINAAALPTDPKLHHAQATGRYIPVPKQMAESLADGWREVGNASSDLTAALAASSDLVGCHPRHAAAISTVKVPQNAVPAEDGLTKVPGATKILGPVAIELAARHKTPSDTPCEATTITSTRQTLESIASTAQRAFSVIDTLFESLEGMDLDRQSLADTAEIIEVASALRAAAVQALTGLDNRHSAVEEMVNAASHPAES
ncbi:MAG: hypothetical protein ACRDN9_14385 [Streptosporangiaceae bacterium]